MCFLCWNLGQLLQNFQPCLSFLVWALARIVIAIIYRMYWSIGVSEGYHVFCRNRWCAHLRVFIWHIYFWCLIWYVLLVVVVAIIIYVHVFLNYHLSVSIVIHVWYFFIKFFNRQIWFVFETNLVPYFITRI